MDVLNDILNTLNLKGAFYFRTDFSGPWAVAVPDLAGAARFHLALQGRCHVGIEGGGNVVLNPGDLVLIPRGRGHTLADAPGRSGATLAIHLSVRNLARIVRELTPLYGADCPAIVIYRATWPDETAIRGTLADIREKVRAAKLTRTALIFVGRVFADGEFDDSRLYAADHHHVLRPRARSE